MAQLNDMEAFQRDISYRVLSREDGTALLTATLNDRFHDIAVEVVVQTETLAIVTAMVEFRKSPTADCERVSARLAGLVGFVIGRGLQKKLAEVLGGVEGCGNIRTLLLGLLPLAMNLKAAAGVSGEREMLDAIHERMLGTCAGYQNPVPKREKG